MLLSINLISKMASHNVHVISSPEQYPRLISTHDRVVVNVTASWCGPCQEFKPYFLAKAVKCSTTEFVFVDVDEAYDMDLDHPDVDDVKNVPTFIFYKNGQPIYRFVGVNKKEFNRGIKMLYKTRSSKKGKKVGKDKKDRTRRERPEPVNYEGNSGQELICSCSDTE
jgi:thioredoxin 1